MAAKRKKKQRRTEADETPKPARKRKRKRKAAAKRKRASRSSKKSGAPKRRRSKLQLVLQVHDVPITSPSLTGLSDGQRLDLAAMPQRKTLAVRPAWAVDDAVWRKAVRVVGPYWNRLTSPWPTVAWAYMRLEGRVGSGRGVISRSDDDSDERAPRRRSSTRQREVQHDDSSTEQTRVERVHVDETGIDEHGVFRGRGVFWRVWNTSIDSVVRAATAAAARAIVLGRG